MEPVHFTRLKLMGRSPAHYHEADQEEAYHLERGSAVHSLVLGGAKVLGYPGKVRRGKEWEAFEAEHPDAIILTGNEFEKAEAIAKAVRAHPLAMQVLRGQHEQVVDWKYLGRACQSRVDVIADEHIAELKTTMNADPSKFTFQALRLAYHAQLAFYAQAVTASGLGSPQAAYVVAVESSAPYAVTVMRMTPRTLELGARLCRLWMERLLACEAADRWPAYCESIVELDIPEDFELNFAEEAPLAGGSAEVPF
jgi:hypothetical protein